MAGSFEHIHLYRRVGFGALPADITAQEAIPETVQKLLTKKSAFKLRSAVKYPANWPSLSPSEKEDLRKQGRQESQLLGGKWLIEMSRTEAILHEKMTLFWHNHFACFIGGRPDFGATLNNTLRQHAMGNFITLTKAVAREPAMLDYLNNNQNKKASPNENFARELLELFTIGRDNYTENDIKEAARAFTGWGHDAHGNFKLRKQQHDFGQKVFFGQSGNFNGDDIIDIVCTDRRTARHLAQRLYLFFVSDSVNRDHVTDLADTLYANSYELKPTLEYLFMADWFYETAGQKIKSPTELSVGLMRSFALKFREPATLVYLQNRSGQHLFKPPNVAGWPGGKNWLDNSTLAFRMKMPALMLNGGIIEWNPITDSVQSQERKEAQREKYKSKAQKRIKIDHDWQASQQKWPAFDDSLVALNLPVISAAGQRMIKLSKKDFVSLSSTVLALPEYQLC